MPPGAFRLQLWLERFVNFAPSWCALWLRRFHHEKREEMQDKRQKAKGKKLKIPNIKMQITRDLNPASSSQKPAAG